MQYGVISLVLCISTRLRLVTILTLLMKYLVIFHTYIYGPTRLHYPACLCAWVKNKEDIFGVHVCVCVQKNCNLAIERSDLPQIAMASDSSVTLLICLSNFSPLLATPTIYYGQALGELLYFNQDMPKTPKFHSMSSLSQALLVCGGLVLYLAIALGSLPARIYAE